MKDIKGYEGLYGITSCGKVWSYRRKKFLKPFNNGIGYLKINLYRDGKKKAVYIHRLVAEAYIPNSDNLPQVNHIDGNKNHNFIKNLDWVTASENNQHAYDTGLHKTIKVKCIELDKVFDSVTDAAKFVNRNKSGIVMVCRGKHKTCARYHWEYVEEGL